MREARVLIAAAGGAVLALAASAQFASVVVEYRPAPGQFINGGVSGEGFSFGDPSAALGAPVGGSLFAPANSKLVSLGGFGGSIVLGFAETVWDDPLNPYGVDAVVFGNAFWVGGDGQRRSAEAGVIEISRDENGNGVADDAWYLVPGSSIDGGDALSVLRAQSWDDDGGTATPPLNLSWYPDAGAFPELAGMYETVGFELPGAFAGFVLENGGGDAESFYGYADVSPVIAAGDVDGDGTVDESVGDADWFTRADNPFVVGVDAGTGGGDGFDIAWAIDPATGEVARLDGFDFVRISTGVDVVLGVFGEKSTEVGGVSDAAGDAGFFDVDGDGALTAEDAYAFEAGPVDLTGEGVVDGGDRAMLVRAVRAGEAGDVGGAR